MYRKLFAIGLIYLLVFLLTLHTADAQAPIRGPWLWMIAPTEPNRGGQASTNVDSLSAASGGRVTETNVATNGAQAGNIVGNYAWTPGVLPNNGDINAMLIDIGMTTNYLDDHSSYALITVVSAADLRGVSMGASSDDAIKIWLNGEVVHTNAVNRGRGGTPVNIRDYQDRFSVNLNRGNNLLMVKVSERGAGWGMYVGIDANVTYRLPDTETVSNVSSDTETTTSSMEFRVNGGTAVDYIDSQGRVWWGAQKTNQTWGGWVGNLPRIAQDPTLTAGARAQATAAGYDSELFLAVSWALYPNTVKYQFKTGNGVFDVTYLVGEHWSPNARGFDIIIEGEVVEPLYITPGRHEIDIRTYKGIEVRDGTLDLEFSGNPATGVADLNGMFSALEVVSATEIPSTTVMEDTTPAADINRDGVVDIQDLMLVAENFTQTGENAADVNNDGVVNIIDLTLVAEALSETATAPSVHAAILEHFTVSQIEQWLKAARTVNLPNATFQRGIRFLEQLLLALTPQETALLANYPNPFNPETWIPYQLAEPAEVKLQIHAIDGKLIRMLALGTQSAGIYQSRNRAAYWDGRNHTGEPVASGVYFYTLTAGDFTATRKMFIRK